MAKSKSSSLIQAVCVVKINEILCKSFALTIVDGVVIKSSELTRAEDLPRIAIGAAQQMLWTQARTNRDVPE